MDGFDCPEPPVIQFDLARVLQTSDWTDRRHDIDTVINDAALLREPDLGPVHGAWSKVRYAGAEQSGVEKRGPNFGHQCAPGRGSFAKAPPPVIRKMTNYSDIDWSDCHGSVAKRP